MATDEADNICAENRARDAAMRASGIPRMMAILKEHGIEMAVDGGCGCCGAPTVSFRYRGEVILDEITEADFDMRRSG